jgi:hypothetical protein
MLLTLAVDFPDFDFLGMACMEIAARNEAERR